MYGMGEKQIVRIADKLRDGVPVNEITDIQERAIYHLNMMNKILFLFRVMKNV